MENRGERKLEPKTEQKEKRGPEISYHFFYSPHRTVKDFENFEKAFGKSNLYAIENLGWHEEEKKYYDDLSKGKITPEKLYEHLSGSKITPEKLAEKKKTARFKEWETIYNSKKPILFTDISSQDSDFFIQGLDCFSLQSRADELFRAGFFKESLAEFRSFLEGYAKLHSEREEKIKENLDWEIEEFLKANPDYGKKEKLKVLVKLGGFHTKIYREFKKERRTVSREFNQLPHVFNHFDEALRKITFNEQLSNETIAQAMIADVLYGRFNHLSNDSVKLDKTLRHLSSRLTINDIEQISQNLGQSPNSDDKTFIKEIEKFGVKVPKSEKEIDEMLELNHK